jgi:hypothetical protein
LNKAAAADHEFCLGKFYRPSADIHIAATYGVANGGESESKPAQTVRVDDNGVLLDEASDTGDFGHALRLGNGKAHVPILKGAKLGEIVLCAGDGILVDPTNAGCVGAKNRRYASGQPPGGGTQIFKNAAARRVSCRPQR